jgi:hypothetical protein
MNKVSGIRYRVSVVSANFQVSVSGIGYPIPSHKVSIGIRYRKNLKTGIGIGYPIPKKRPDTEPLVGSNDGGVGKLYGVK